MTLDATGLTIKTAAEIEAEILADVKDPAVLGPQAQLGGESPLGQIIAAVSQQLGTCYELVQLVYEAHDPDAASGVQLESTCALAPITREAATYSTGTLTITGTPATFVATGYLVRVPSGPQFITTADATIGGGGTIDVAIRAVDLGPVEASAGTITEPITSVPGVTSITNALAVAVGQDQESDEDLRQRREASLSISGSCTDASIPARLRALSQVSQALIISNRTEYTDSFGIPPHYARPIVYPTPTDSQQILDTLWVYWPAGIAMDGAVTGSVTDSQGVSQPAAYSVATEIAVHIEIVVTTDATTYGGDAAVADAVEAVTSDPRIGADLLLWMLENRVTDDVTGILTIEARAKIGSAPGPSDTANITCALDEILTVDPLDIDVTSS